MSNLNDDRMTRKKEAELVSGVESMINLVNSGHTPTEALQKVASEKNLNEEYVRRVGEAYNQSRTLYELGNRDGQARLGVWETADINKVASALAPKTDSMLFAKHMQKAASTTDFISSWGKARNNSRLSETLGKPHTKAAELSEPGQLGGNLPNPKKEELEVKTKPATASKDDRFIELAKSEEKFSSALNDAVYSLRTGFLQGRPFHEVEKLAHAKWGSNASSIMSALFEMSHAKSAGQRRALSAELDPSSVTLTDLIAPTFASVERLVGAAVDMHKRAGSLGRKPLANRMPAEKKADDDGVLATGVNPAKKVNRSLLGLADAVVGPEDQVRDQAKSLYRDEVGKNVLKLEDPDFKNEGQAIDAKYTLADLMSNDDIIKGYNPDEVLEAFNDISEVAPEAARSGVIMRDLLRRHLTQGGLQAMDVNQAITVNKNLSSDKSTKDRLGSMVYDPRVAQGSEPKKKEKDDNVS